MGESSIQDRLLTALRETSAKRSVPGGSDSRVDAFKCLCVPDINEERIAEVFPPKKFVSLSPSDIKTREGRLPSGILKTNWMVKQQNKVPSVMLALFYIDIRQSVIEWGGRETYIADAVKSLRQLQSTHGYYTKLLVILIQRKIPTGSGPAIDEARKITEERITRYARISLCASALSP
jgi:hypothetical protein